MKNLTYTKEFLAEKGFYAYSDKTCEFYYYDPNVTYDDLTRMDTSELLNRLAELAKQYIEITLDLLDGEITVEEATSESVLNMNRVSDINVVIRLRADYGFEKNIA